MNRRECFYVVNNINMSEDLTMNVALLWSNDPFGLYLIGKSIGNRLKYMRENNI